MSRLPFLFLIILFLSNIKSELIMKFNRYNSLKNYENLFSINVKYFVDYFINNIFTTEIYIGDPAQKIPGYLNPLQSGFYLTKNSCPVKSVYNFHISKSYKLIGINNYYSVVNHRFNDSLYLEYINETINKKYDYEFFSDANLNEPICFLFGTRLLASGEYIEDNLLNRLHKEKLIKSYFYTFKIINNDEMDFIFDVDIKNDDNEYSFVKATTKQNYQILIWGLEIDSLKLNDTVLANEPFKAEFNINLGCMIGSHSFQDTFKNYLYENHIFVTPEIYNNKYEIFVFNKKNHQNKLKKISLSFYHSVLSYNFVLEYEDIFYEKNDLIYCLIIFNNDKKREYWELGTPFLKKFKFFYDHDKRIIGFTKNNKENDIHDNKSKESDNKSNNNFKIILTIVLSVIFIIIITLFFGFLIGKKVYKVRKNKTNELLELYDYNSKNDNNK